MKRLALLLSLSAGCAAQPPRDVRMEVRYHDPAGAVVERHVLVVPIEKRYVVEIDGVWYRFTLHQDYTVGL